MNVAVIVAAFAGAVLGSAAMIGTLFAWTSWADKKERKQRQSETA